MRPVSYNPAAPTDFVNAAKQIVVLQPLGRAGTELEANKKEYYEEAEKANREPINEGENRVKEREIIEGGRP
jgi:hypothetical protein